MLPSLSDQGVLQSIRAIDSSVEGKPLKTHPGIPMGGGVVAGEVLNFLDVIVLLKGITTPFLTKARTRQAWVSFGEQT